MGYTAANPITGDAYKVLLHLGATVKGQTVRHKGLTKRKTRTWAGAWKGSWVQVNEISIQGIQFLDDNHYESFRLCTEDGRTLAASL